MAGICSAHQGYDIDCAMCNVAASLITRNDLLNEIRNLTDAIHLKDAEIQRHKEKILSLINKLEEKK
jgi:hypothetical protein